ncbi:hypothetical protein AB9H28_25655, partial [Salmonella enterica subsp. enterica serovar Kentucky]|uniref:hypothetical protein n=1 Tax=Salmonella enterica TaxID=28901 RepID=UPI003F4C815A
MRKQNNLIAAGLLGLLVAACSAISDAATTLTDGVQCDPSSSKHWYKEHRFNHHPLVESFGITILVNTRGEYVTCLLYT